MSNWTESQLSTFNETDELNVSWTRSNNQASKPVIVWMVVHDGNLYARSVNGPDATWYKGVTASGAGSVSAGSLEANVRYVAADNENGTVLDELYQAKYGDKYPQEYVTACMSGEAQQCTVRIEPA